MKSGRDSAISENHPSMGPVPSPSAASDRGATDDRDDRDDRGATDDRDDSGATDDRGGREPEADRRASTSVPSPRSVPR
jgi:hypothetical protein